MKDPALIGIAASIGTVMILSVWKAKRLRWAVIGLLLFIGLMALADWANPTTITWPPSWGAAAGISSPPDHFF